MAVTWTFKEEIAWASQPMAASPSWTDVTTFVLVGQAPVLISVGRADEFSDVEFSTLSRVLKNHDGRFSPGLTGGPYGANVKIARRNRITLTRSAVNYVRFDGHLDNLPVSWDYGRTTLAVAAVGSTDRLKRYSQAGELRSMVEHEILRDTPKIYYPLGENEGATSAGDVSGSGQPGMTVTQRGIGGAVDFGAGTGPGTDSLSAPMFTPASVTDGKYLEARALSTPVAGASITLECFVRCEPTVTSRNICALTASLAAEDDFDTELKLSVDASGYLQGQLRIANGAEYTIASDAIGVKVNDDQTHHVALVDHWNAGSPVATLYLDGVEANSDISYSRPSSFTFTRVLAGGNRGGEMLAGTVSHLAGFATNLSATRVGVHSGAGLNGMAGERSDQRIGRIADYVGIPTADRQFDVGDSLVGGQSISGRPALDVMREVARTENGVVFFNPADGKLTFHNRSRRYNKAVDVTLSAASKQITQGLQFPGDDFGMVNDETVASAGGASARYFSQALIDEYTLYRNSKDTAANSADDAFQIAAWDVGNYGAPLPKRTPNVTVDIRRLEETGPSLIAGLLSATIGTKLSLTGLPSQAPASTVNVFIEGWSEEITSTSWRITYNTSPADVAEVWQLGTSGHTELGDTTRLAL